MWQDSLVEQWDEKHRCKYTVGVHVNLTINVDGYDTEEPEDLHDRIDNAISEICDVLYHNKDTTWFDNMERDIEYNIDVRDVE